MVTSPRGLRSNEPRQIGEYRILSLLGKGGQGTVYLGLAPDGRRVAIKALLPQWASDPKTCRRFLREAEVAAKVAAFCTAKIVGTGKDLALELNYATKADNAYPMTLVTYEIVCDKGNKAETLPATKSFLNYIASEDGQALLADAGYAPIPDEIIGKVRETIDGLA